MSFYTPTPDILLKIEEVDWYIKQDYCNFISYKKEIAVSKLWKELEMEYEFYFLNLKTLRKNKNKDKEFTCSLLDDPLLQESFYKDPLFHEDYFYEALLNEFVFDD